MFSIENYIKKPIDSKIACSVDASTTNFLSDTTLPFLFGSRLNKLFSNRDQFFGLVAVSINSFLEGPLYSLRRP